MKIVQKQPEFEGSEATSEPLTGFLPWQEPPEVVRYEWMANCTAINSKVFTQSQVF
jgi:hypothetical protein